MITLKEYEIYLKVKKFIEIIDCDENELIPKLTNGIGTIPTYIPLIIEFDDMEPTKYYSLSVAARGCGIPKQTIVYAYRNEKMRIAKRKDRPKVFTSNGWINFIWGQINSICPRILFVLECYFALECYLC